MDILQRSRSQANIFVKRLCSWHKSLLLFFLLAFYMGTIYRAFCVALVGLAATLLPRAGAAQIVAQTLGGGNGHSVLLTPDGSLRAWGYNASGQLGISTTASTSSPTPAGTATTYAQLAVGAFHTVSLRANGTLWTWVATLLVNSATGLLPRTLRLGR